MMGEQKSEPQLFNYAVNLEKRVRANHPLRQVKAIIDFSFVRGGGALLRQERQRVSAA
jgi:hypothetical protein